MMLYDLLREILITVSTTTADALLNWPLYFRAKCRQAKEPPPQGIKQHYTGASLYIAVAAPTMFLNRAIASMLNRIFPPKEGERSHGSAAVIAFVSGAASSPLATHVEHAAICKTALAPKGKWHGFLGLMREMAKTRGVVSTILSPPGLKHMAMRDGLFTLGYHYGVNSTTKYLLQYFPPLQASEDPLKPNLLGRTTAAVLVGTGVGMANNLFATAASYHQGQSATALLEANAQVKYASLKTMSQDFGGVFQFAGRGALTRIPSLAGAMGVWTYGPEIVERLIDQFEGAINRLSIRKG